MISLNWKRLVGCLSLVVVCLLTGANGITIPFFGTFGSSSQKTSPPLSYNEQKDARIINADHGGALALSPPSSAATASLAGGSFAGSSPWISGTRDQFIRDQLVVIHPDSPLNREVWKDSGYLNSELLKTPKDIDISNNENRDGMRPLARIPPERFGKPTRKSKQQQEALPSVVDSIAEQFEYNGSPMTKDNTNNVSPSTVIQSPSFPPTATLLTPSLYDYTPPFSMFRDLSQIPSNADMTPIDSSEEPGMFLQHDPVFVPANNVLYPFTTPMFPYSSRAIPSHSTLPSEAVIQLLKSPEQELSSLTRPQVKLPFPLSRDCSANSGSKPLQFVVLPIVEPVAPLKPIFPKPSFLSSQYGQFPYIPPFNLFTKKPPVFHTSNLDGSPSNGIGPVGAASSGQFVPILNRPAPPLPFVFVQSLPLELIGQHMEMDVLNSSPSQTSESKIKEVIPIAAPVPSQSAPVSSSVPEPQAVPSSVQATLENFPALPRPLPLIVIEKVKTPGQPPSSPVAPAAAVVEISKQSVPKSGSTSGSPALSTISVIKPITAPGKKPQTLEQQQEIHKAIEKLVPVAAAVLENVEKQQQQQKQQKDGSDKIVTTVSPVTSTNAPVAAATTASTARPVEKEPEKSSLRPPLRPDPMKETVALSKVPSKPAEVPTSEEIVGVNPTSMSDVVEITEV